MTWKEILKEEKRSAEEILSDLAIEMTAKQAFDKFRTD